MDLVFGKVLIMILIWDNGRITRHGGMEFTTGQMVISMKASGKHPLKMVKELISLQIRMYTLVFTKTASLTAMASTDGAKVQPTSESLKLE